MSGNTETTPFDRYAENYDAALAKGISVSGEDKAFFARGRIQFLKALLEPMGFQPRNLMDYGCGTGSATPYLRDTFDIQTLIGVDVSLPSLRIAEQRYRFEGSRFVPVQDYRPQQTLDLAFCNGVLHHIPPAERLECVRYIFDALRPGGLFALWENNPWNPGTRYVMSRCPFDDDAITLTPPEAKRLVAETGFEVLRTDFLFIFPRFLAPLRGLEPKVSRLPLGAQYQVLCRKGV